MNEIIELHGEAMELADKAAEARRLQDGARFLQLSRAAFEKEAAAAQRLVERFDLEPTRSVLLRSAASLALDCGEIRRAEQLISGALAGNPPEEIADELRDLLENVNFHRHLALRGVSLQPDEFQMSIEGPAVGFGVARTDHFVRRVKGLETLIYRTAERRLGREFRDAGRRKQKLADELELYLSVPRAASFAVTFKLGKSEQLTLPGMNFPREVIEDLLDCFDLLNRGAADELHSRIPDGSYYRNFVGLAHNIAPDGRAIKAVGFTAPTPTGERTIAFSRTRAAVRDVSSALVDRPYTPALSQVEVQGTLLEADAKSRKTGRIEVVDSAGRLFKIRVPRGMMSDIVKPMFEEEVVVTGRQMKDYIELESIDLAGEADAG
jgi:hypothetical protein